MAFEVDQEVEHTVFGKGKVTRVEQRGVCLPDLITIEFKQETFTPPEDWNGVGIPDPARCTYGSISVSRRVLGTSDKLKKVE